MGRLCGMCGGGCRPVFETMMVGPIVSFFVYYCISGCDNACIALLAPCYFTLLFSVLAQEDEYCPLYSYCAPQFLVFCLEMICCLLPLIVSMRIIDLCIT